MNSNTTDDEIELEDAAKSWLPIVVPLVLTAAQVVVFLIIYECSRRSEKVGDVYDRRRMVYPNRTPPPLMQRRGCCRGYLAFEWWRVRVADEAYRQQSIQEYKERKKEKLQREQREEANVESAREADRALVQRAERMCYRESPFFDPVEEDDMSIRDDEESQAVATVPDPALSARIRAKRTTTKKPNMEDKASNDTNTDETLATDRSSNGRSVSIAVGMDTCNLPEHSSENGNVSFQAQPLPPLLQVPPRPGTLERPRGILRSRSIESLDTLGGSEWVHRVRLGVPEIVGGTNRVRIGGDPDVSLHTIRDTKIGSEEAERLAKFRFEAEDTADWDRRTANAVVHFLRNRVLKLKDGEDEDEDEDGKEDEDPPAHTAVTERTHQQKFLMQKVLRRSLSAEQRELLRDVGLDAFMTLRFLRFFVDVSFWPLLLSAVFLIPIYKTGNRDVNGFFSATVLNLDKGSARHWAVVIFGYVQFSYILRRIWIEWELFLPLRYDFLENGDFQKQKYQEQYRKTCLVEYVPRSHKRDKVLYEFFDAIFPGEVKRAEVLLNTEYIRSLIEERQKHILGYENTYAKKVHGTADYLRDVKSVEEGHILHRCCGRIRNPKEPEEPQITVIHQIPRQDMGNALLNPQTLMVKDPRTYNALEWHHSNIQRLNKEIDDEYLRLVQAQHRPLPPQKKESRLAKWLGIKYLTSADTGTLHSSTAFVEFNSVTAKQEAIQCNITGTNHLMVVQPVPEIREMIWRNASVSRALISTRRAWANLGLIGGLVAWSFIVVLIRSIDNINEWFNIDQQFLVTFLNTYVPAMVVEGLVRGIPFVVKFVCYKIRMKSSSEIDLYILRWYFCFRLITFLMVIIGGSITQVGQRFLDDPIGFLREISAKAVEQAPFFISYVTVTGGMQVFFRLSQLHNLSIYWFIHKVTTEESVSQRYLDRLNHSIRRFHLDEFIPLFIFVFMVGGLYGSLAPVANLFVATFFILAYRVFKYMTLFIYGNDYEGGGFLFYTLTNIMFYMLYLLIVLIAGYLSLAATGATSIIFVLLVPVVVVVHLTVYHTFMLPSRTLSLAKARLSDETKDKHLLKEKKLEAYLKAKAELEKLEGRDDNGSGERSVLRRRLLPRRDSIATEGQDTDGTGTNGSGNESSSDSERRRKSAVERFQLRYQENDDSFSDLTSNCCSDGFCPSQDFFIYRQPEMNRATWEFEPRPYRDSEPREQEFVFW